jgi:hypothetical protein
MRNICLVQVRSSKNGTLIENPLIPPTLNEMKPQKNFPIL